MFAILSSKRPQAPSIPAQATTRSNAAADAWLDPLPLPEVVNDDPEASWALWDAAVRGQAPQEADTVLMGLMPA